MDIIIPDSMILYRYNTFIMYRLEGHEESTRVDMGK